MAKDTIKIGTLVGAGAKAPEYISQIIDYGFESFSLTYWETNKGIDFKKLAPAVKEACGDKAIISSLGVFGNPLTGDVKAKENIESWKRAIYACELFGCDIVAGFTGRVLNTPIDGSMKAFKKVFTPLAQRAADKGVRIAFENCDMGGTWQSGDWNIAQYPVAWEMMFNEVPMGNMGLEWEPCHQMVKLIDPMPQLRKWVKKIFHVHGKDATVLWDVVREYGVTGPKQFAYHRTPGFGDSNWTDIISVLRQGGFVGSIDIEGWHDPVYRDVLEMTGQVAGMEYLKRCRGGELIPNPVV